MQYLGRDFDSGAPSALLWGPIDKKIWLSIVGFHMTSLKFKLESYR